MVRHLPGGIGAKRRVVNAHDRKNRSSRLDKGLRHCRGHLGRWPGRD